MKSTDDALNEVLSMLNGLLEKAVEIEADVGTMPTAEEALVWAIGEVEGLIRRQAGTSE